MLLIRVLPSLLRLGLHTFVITRIQHLRPQVPHQFLTMASQPIQLTPDSEFQSGRSSCGASTLTILTRVAFLRALGRLLQGLGSSVSEIPFRTFLDDLAPPQPD